MVRKCGTFLDDLSVENRQGFVTLVVIVCSILLIGAGIQIGKLFV